MAAKSLPSPEVLRQLLRYETETGKLFWRLRDQSWFPSKRSCSSWNARYAEKEAFVKRERFGHLVGYVLGEPYKAHRIIWVMVFGEVPPEMIDHINKNPSDNRISNLRLASAQQNAFNSKSRSNATSAFVGVYLHRITGKWAASINTGGERHRHLGLFDNEGCAALAYDAAARARGEFANFNFPLAEQQAAKEPV